MESEASSVPAPSASVRVQRSQALDDLIMGTNSSSIVSKRSVERLYYPDEPHYFRYFVKKFQRRAPLINRGYWLRLRAIDVIVHQFLSRSAGQRVIINLGCGSDVLPWQSHVRYGDECRDALFIDIDYPDLMHKKRALVLETPQLKELLGPSFEVSKSDKDLVLLKSEKYCQIGCDLRELEALRQVLDTLVDLSNCPVLFVAEVSVTYMDTESADNLLKWASSVGKAEFCLLEQLLPYGRSHPFAQTMLKHFDKLKTPPRSVGHYPTVGDQCERFKSRGWSSVRIWDLWDAWCCGEFVNAQQRASLDDVEPFDEWEEFILFARHYFVLHASAAENLETIHDATSTQTSKSSSSKELEIQFTTIPGSSKRRFGAPATLQNAEGRSFGLNVMGLGPNARDGSYDVYSLDGGISEDYFVFNPEKGWLQCKTVGDVPKPSFGSIVCNNPVGSSTGKFSGLFCGGIEKTGLVVEEKYEWTLDMASQQPTITFTSARKDFVPELSIFGANVVDLNGNTLVCGGMGADRRVDGQAMYCLTSSESNVEVAIIKQCLGDAAIKPFMIGSSTLYHDGFIIIAGGGSFPHTASITTIPRISLISTSEFESILRRGQPVVIENLQLGECIEKWTAAYIIDRVGSDKKVVVHECQIETGKMDFNAKNFQYVTENFGNIMARAKNGDRLYLRSLSNDKPTEQPAKLEEDFPGLAMDFVLPEQLRYVKEQLFSSVLRVSGKVNMWLHYDVMANVYAQVVGSKRMILFPPSDVPQLAFAPGASSSSVDVFSSLETPKLARTRPHEAIVRPGDVLFLPPLWLHTATPTTDMSVAVNIFFRDLDSGYAAGRDVYGNRDLAAYEKGRQDVAKIAKQFQQLPEETRKFYLARLADELLQSGEGN
ncbi:hypothetical protein LMH87_009780 [Akanthomyces muscarius]|uniref:tRNA wybutosine-synthesizing protein 4 n=1 Tax=Akanthomyces muscarius TaxID=2231603 RepID=A0A9W8QCS9_AKAMU|nr:hypothetical protein LMH87_009780 [Akanthomyces muscarius]KAJ4153285.1 hypothetical protein LMH87_009780 [Akanthomyces muscarius]